MSDKLKLLVTGCHGRMGQAVIHCAADFPEIEVAATIDVDDDLNAAVSKTEAVIDFTQHGFSAGLVNACLESGNALVMGTTGHTDDERALIHEAAGKIPIVLAPNFSVGVNTLFWLTQKAASVLQPGFDIEVVEMHHRHKTDSPSGTARRLGEILAATTGRSYENDTRHGRVGDVGARTEQEIGMHALRGGDVVGDHTVIFAASGERVELSHKASSRETFARGALRAALWLRGRSSGLFDMQDVLGLK